MLNSDLSGKVNVAIMTSTIVASTPLGSALGNIYSGQKLIEQFANYNANIVNNAKAIIVYNCNSTADSRVMGYGNYVNGYIVVNTPFSDRTFNVSVAVIY